MIEADLQKLVAKIRSLKAEFQTVEVKKCNTGISHKLYDTLSSFSNQDDGGIIVFGLDESNGFEPCGVYDVQDLQKKVMEQCESMTPTVRAVFCVCEIDGVYIVAAEIPSVDIVERPCFYSGKGRIKGSYIRVGDADKPMTEYEIYSYEAYRKKYQDDIRLIENIDLSIIDNEKLQSYILNLKLDKPNLSKLDEQTIYNLMNIVKNGKPTLTALLIFGLYPQATVPQLSIIATSYAGNAVGEVGAENERFIDNKRIEGTISEMLDRALVFVKNNMKVKTIINAETGKRTDKTEYPIGAVREAILNALVHRDYSIHSEGMPVQILMFSDRMEIKSPGGLYGRVTLDNLGKIQPDTRNPVLATVLETLKVTENRYSGIPTIQRECREWNLPEPEFRNERGEFTVVFRKQSEFNSSDNIIYSKIIEFCKTPRSRKEIAEFLNLKAVSYVMSTYVQPLIDQNRIDMTIPDRPSSSKQKYFTIR